MKRNRPIDQKSIGRHKHSVTVQHAFCDRSFEIFYTPLTTSTTDNNDAPPKHSTMEGKVHEHLPKQPSTLFLPLVHADTRQRFP